MSLDVVDLKGFYTSPLGLVAQHTLARLIQVRWPRTQGMAVLGLGYATPYLEGLRQGAERTLAFMPAAQGVMYWPEGGLSASALVQAVDLPLRDAAIDRLLLVHALEVAESPLDLLSEIWRVLAPGGRLIAVVPNRRGMWARLDATPFGQGQPFSRAQVTELMRQALFTPIHWGEALYFPPAQGLWVGRTAAAWERVGATLSLPFAGVHLIEATKQVYRPVLHRNPARRRFALAPAPALLPGN
jgi:SAM-dependent methyltransferase